MEKESLNLLLSICNSQIPLVSRLTLNLVHLDEEACLASAHFPPLSSCSVLIIDPGRTTAQPKNRQKSASIHFHVPVMSYTIARFHFPQASYKLEGRYISLCSPVYANIVRADRG